MALKKCWQLTNLRTGGKTPFFLIIDFFTLITFYWITEAVKLKFLIIKSNVALLFRLIIRHLSMYNVFIQVLFCLFKMSSCQLSGID